MISLDKVSRSFGTGAAAVPAVREVSLTIEPGTFTTIVGASGSGKTTLLHLMGALDQPTSGTVLIDGKNVGQLDDDDRTRLRRDRIGFVFQFFNLLPTLTALENVALPARLAGRSRGKTTTRAAELLERVGLAKRKDHRPDQMSGGEMQRVAIARALMMDPPVLLADEPTGNLDSSTGVTILELIRGTVDANRTVILVTHDPSVAKLGDRIVTMGDGKIVGDERGPKSSRPPPP